MIQLICAIFLYMTLLLYPAREAQGNSTTVVRDGGENPPCQFSYWCDGQPDVPKQNQALSLARESRLKC
jgi:hypothetical protein